jgi:hypothetical protein
MFAHFPPKEIVGLDAPSVDGRVSSRANGKNTVQIENLTQAGREIFASRPFGH